ncbi:hypothetical protein CERZMDRAFT_97127 [Cercospora zeae-maydis SCOH1-5]|uniref:Transcription factor domain-containing protein n=1 Tax=Cercospora zeae-maydis SCOH1-5 TaxID=717836 RepID=A0A6A6FGS6_9PEZI|nr:hypothetical protein CERZMDRAFT_97127 [Cercospora zeae-maydis SCOH1-5]
MTIALVHDGRGTESKFPAAKFAAQQPVDADVECCLSNETRKDSVVQATDAVRSPHSTSSRGSDVQTSSNTTASFSLSTIACTPEADLEFGLVRKENSLDIATAMSLYALPQYMPSGAAEKAMIYSTFVDTYMPKHRPERDAHFSFLEHLITSPGLRPEVSQALDALCLVQVGSIFHDQTLLKQSVRMYAKALTGLVRTLGNRDTSAFIKDDYVLATVTLLAACEFFDEISQMGEGWSKHLQGSQQLLKARGPASIKTKMSLMLYSNMRHGGLSHALIARKGTFLGKPEWRALAWCDEIRDASTAFYEYALQVPDLLERWDDYVQKGEIFVEALDAFLVEAKVLERGLRIWFEDFRLQAKSSGKALYALAHIEEFQPFCKLISDRTVDKAFMFSSFMVAYLVSVYWDVMHFLRTTIKALHHARYQVQSDWFPSSEDAVTQDELMEYVMNMMRCFPFFCEPTSSSTGQIGIFLPLRTAAFFCLEHGHWPLLKWLGAVRDGIFTKGMRPPSVRESRPANTNVSISIRPGAPVIKNGVAYHVSPGGSKITYANMMQK